MLHGAEGRCRVQEGAVERAIVVQCILVHIVHDLYRGFAPSSLYEAELMGVTALPEDRRAPPEPR